VADAGELGDALFELGHLGSEDELAVVENGRDAPVDVEAKPRLLPLEVEQRNVAPLGRYKGRGRRLCCYSAEHGTSVEDAAVRER
jgi:hypothetical protein